MAVPANRVSPGRLPVGFFAAVKTDKASGIVNDPNDWSREVGDSLYILDVLVRFVTVSLDTMETVDELPALAVREEQG